MGKSWFYLTLFRGTPPEMTEAINVQIARHDDASAEIQKLNEASASVETRFDENVSIVKTESADATITKVTEVVWYVG